MNDLLVVTVLIFAGIGVCCSVMTVWRHIFGPNDSLWTYRTLDDTPTQFRNWAFGQLWHKFDSPKQFMNAWNELHGDLMVISGDELIHVSLKKMRTFYAESQKSWKGRP